MYSGKCSGLVLVFITAILPTVCDLDVHNDKSWETMGRQHQREDWPWMEYTTKESWEPQGVEKAGCKIYSGAPTVSQTTR